MKIKINKDIYLDRIFDSDIPSLVKWCNDPEIYRNTSSFPKEYTEDSAKAFLEIISKNEKEHGFQQTWGIRWAENGEMIGAIGLLNFAGDPIYKSEFGYWIAQPYRGKGYTTSVVNGFVDFIVPKFKLIRIFAHVMEHNIASKKVLEKAGFVNEALLKNNMQKEGKSINTWLFAKYY
ncbi:MAG: GNAT family N-acetyltransferase [Saprospiraceae bacterium]